MLCAVTRSKPAARPARARPSRRRASALTCRRGGPRTTVRSRCPPALLPAARAVTTSHALKHASGKPAAVAAFTAQVPLHVETGRNLRKGFSKHRRVPSAFQLMDTITQITSTAWLPSSGCTACKIDGHGALHASPGMADSVPQTLPAGQLPPAVRQGLRPSGLHGPRHLRHQLRPLHQMPQLQLLRVLHRQCAQRLQLHLRPAGAPSSLSSPETTIEDLSPYVPVLS